MARSRRPIPAAERFVTVWRRIWRSGGTLREVAKQLRISPRQATTRAHTLRKHGVDLGQFSAAGPRIDYERLKAE